ncbi:M56 family metallopeptidase [Mycobacterium sp. 050134]|uniref:M56 family metallopeptidase n=1 Tax=Mycobacterium sp. 050134 TaxID=3096111 RepID=UPI002EDBB179
MSVAACLLLYSAVACIGGPPLLRRLTRDGRTPRLGVAAWVAAICSVLIAWLAVTAFVIADAVSNGGDPAAAAVSCISRLHGAAMGRGGTAAQALLVLIAATSSIAAAVFATRLALTLLRMRSRAHEHAESVRIVGRHNGDRGVFVVDAGEPAAYCVSGRPPAIVVTSGALSALDQSQLAAVLAHERAHLANGHTQLSAALRGLAAVFPFVPLMTQGAAEVSRLLEMWADDVAARQHGRWALLSGLITLAGATPAPALGAANVAVLARAERLMLPPAGRTGARTALTGMVAVIVAGPLFAAVLAACRLMCEM